MTLKDSFWTLRLICLVSALALLPLIAWMNARGAPGDGGVRQGAFRGLPALLLSNDLLELTILPHGGAFVRMVLKDDPEKLNPMWDSLRADYEAGRAVRGGTFTGHFVCVDGFGPSSEAEQKAGLPFHGEAATLHWITRSAEKKGNLATLVQAVQLPKVQELLVRKLSLVDGENVIQVHSKLENLMAFDRPICWAEHATIGSPFLERGVTVVDMSKNRAMTRPRPPGYRQQGLPDWAVHRFDHGKEFGWPMAPTGEGGTVDLRAAPAEPSTDHTGHLMTPSGEHAWVTALHPPQRLLLGYVFKTSEFPWMQTWEHYPAEGTMARGLEFGTQTFDLPRRQVISEGERWGTPLFRWLPAKSTIETTYLMFLARTPEGFQGVDRIEVKDGAIQIEDKRSGKQLTLRTSQTL